MSIRQAAIGENRLRPLALACLLCVLTLQPAHGQQPDSSTQSSPKPAAQQENVVVTGTFSPVPETEIDRSLTVIEVPEQSLLFKSWIDDLGFAPSVDLQQRSPSDIQGDLTIRGSTFGETLVLLNGLRMDDVQSGHHDMDLPLPTGSVQRVEVLRGAGSTLYGSDAMAGSVNVITAVPQRSDIQIGAGVGNFGINQQSGSASFLWKNFDEQLDAERDFSSGFRPDRDYRSFTAFSTTGATSFLGQSLLMLGFGDKPFGADQFYGPFDSWERTKSWFLGLKQDIGSKTEFDFGFRRHTDEFVLFRNQPSIYENNHVDKSWQADVRRRDPLSKNSTLLYGAEGIHESIASNNLGDHDRSRGAVYLDYDVRVLQRFSFSLGAREEIFSGSHGEFSPTASAGFWLRPGLKLKGSVGRAFRLPSFTDLEYHDPANFGNPTLGPERAWDYEGGLLWNPNSRITSEVTVFRRRDQDVIDYVLRDCPSIPVDQLPAGTSCSSLATQVYHAENLQHLNFFGVETSVDLRLPREQRLQFAYTALHGAQESLLGLQTKYLFNYPLNSGVVAWTGRLPGRLIARTRVGVVDRFSEDPYALWDAAVAREFSHAAAHFVLSNITDTQYQEIPGIVMPGRSAVFGLDFFLRGR
jgi:iron complex outermembrane recepter protein